MSQSASVTTDKESVLYAVHSLESFAHNIFKTGNMHHVDMVKNAIKRIHSLRIKSPQQEREINAVLFDLHKKSLSAADEAVKQGPVVSFLSGFENHPVSNAQDGKNLICAISESPNLQYLGPIVQRMTINLAKMYKEKLKATDTDMSMARLLKNFVSYYCWQKKKKGITDNNWAYGITHTLAKIYPTPEFQSAADDFQYKTPRVTANKVKLPKGPEVVYHAHLKFSFNHLLKEFDRN